MKPSYPRTVLLVALLFGSVRAAIPTDGLVLFYPLNGSTNDAGPRGNDGGVIGGQFTADRHGSANSAYQVTNAYITSKANLGITGNADRTVSLWFYLQAQPTAPGGNLCSWGSTSGVGNLFSVVYEPWQEQGYKFGLNCGYLKRGFLAGSNPETGRWHHLVCTYTTRLGMARMFLNGVELVGVADPRWGDANSTINTSASSVYVGSLITEWWGIQGSVDDVRIYNRVLSATEAGALHAAESVATTPPNSSSQALTWQCFNSGVVASGPNGGRIIFGNGMFVGAWGKTIATSLDGETWQTRAILPANRAPTVSSLTFGGGRFVAGGNWGEVWASSDGVNWTSGSYSRADPVNSLAYDGTQFVGVGNLGMLMTSPDGLRWTQRAVPTSTNFGGVAWSGSVLVATGGGGGGGPGVVYSTNGITWTVAATQPLSAAHTITFGGGIFVAPCVDGSVVTSSNGSNWVVRSTPISGPNGLGNLVYGDGRFVSAGTGGIVAESNDGITWALGVSGTTANLGGVAYGNGRFVTIEAGTSGKVYVAKSPDCAAQIAALQQQLKDADDLVASLQAQLATANTSISTLQSEKTTLQQQVTSLNGQIAGLNSQITQLQSDKLILNQQLTAATAQFTAANLQVGTLQTDKAVLQQQVTTLTSQLSTLSTQNSQLQSERDGLNRQLAAKTTELTNAVAQITQLESDKSALQQQLDAARSQLAAATTQVARLTTANEALQQQTDSLSTQLSSANSQIRQLTADKATIQQDLDLKRTQLATATATVTQLQTDKAGLQQQLAAKETLLATANTQNTQLQADKAALDQQLATVTAQLNSANALVNQLQSTNATLQQQLNTATTRIAALTTQVNQLTSANAVLITQQNQGLRGLDEILRLLQLPVGRRTSTLRFTGPEGTKVNTILDALLTPPGQNVNGR